MSPCPPLKLLFSFLGLGLMTQHVAEDTIGLPALNSGFEFHEKIIIILTFWWYAV